MKRFAFVLFSCGVLALASVPARAGSASVSIKSGGNEYHPDTVQIRVGDTVTWTNIDRTLFGTNHTVTADDGSFDSGPIRERASFDYLFARPGSFTYHCSIHSGMSGSVIVLAAPTHRPSPTPTPTKTVRTSPKPSASQSARSARPTPTTSPHTSPTATIDASSVGGTNTSAGTILSIAIASIAVLIGLGYFVYLRLVRYR